MTPAIRYGVGPCKSLILKELLAYFGLKKEPISPFLGSKRAIWEESVCSEY